MKISHTTPESFEIVRGEIVRLPPAGDVHGWVEGRTYRVLDEQGGDAGLGAALVGEVGVVVERSPQTVRGADAAFVLQSQFPLERSKEGYLLTPPALIVEVLSPNDRASEVQTKTLEYLRAGVQVVWVADPANRSVTVHCADGVSRILQDQDPLWAPGVLDHLETPVSELFRGLEAFGKETQPPA